MKRILSLVVASSLAVGGAFAGVVGTKTPRRPMALMVFFDGARADCLRNAKCPSLRSLIEGTWSKEYGCAWSDAARNLDDAPTLSYANHASILCGVLASEHGVKFNSWVDRFRGQPTWLNLLADRGIRTAAFHADRADVQLTRTNDVAAVSPTGGDWKEYDRLTAETAVKALASPDAPQASNLFFMNPDEVGHFFGYYPSTDGYLSGFDESDHLLGSALAAIRSRPTFGQEDWMIVFTADHGGKGVRHGPDTGHCHTVPLLVASRHVGRGRLVGTPRTYDLVPTLLAHFGVTPPQGLAGHVLGSEIVPAAKRSLAEGLFLAESFDIRPPHLWDVVTTKGFVGMTVSGYTNHIAVANGYGTICGREDPCSFWTWGTAQAFKGPFTVAWWMLDPGVAYEDNPPVLGNRNNHDDVLEESGRPAPGFTVFLKSQTPPGEKGITLEYLDGSGTVRKLGAFTSCIGQWTFYALVNRGDGSVLLYQGRPDGRLNWIADHAPGACLDSPQCLVLGQDGTAEHHIGFEGCFDETRLWTRALETSEIDALFSLGREGAQSLRPESSTVRAERRVEIERRLKTGGLSEPERHRLQAELALP